MTAKTQQLISDENQKLLSAHRGLVDRAAVLTKELKDMRARHTALEDQMLHKDQEI